MNYAVEEIVNSGCIPSEHAINEASATKQFMSTLRSLDSCGRDVVSQMTRELASMQSEIDRGHICEDPSGIRRQRVFRLVIATLKKHFPGSFANERTASRFRTRLFQNRSESKP